MRNFVLPLPSRPQQMVTKKGVYIYRCPVCRKTERFDDAYGPACTGPGATDTHWMEPMELVGTDTEPLFLPLR